MLFSKYFSKSKRKKETINAILNHEQFNNDVVNIHRIDKSNIGDFFCAPHHYFEELKDKSLDIFDYKSEDDTKRENFINQINNNSLIIGGGGLLNRDGFEKQMKMFEQLTQKGKKIVLWGVGHNEKTSSKNPKKINYNIDVKKFGLVGTRDIDMPGEYVPCVSCLHSIFDNEFQSKNEIGVVFHKDTLKKESIVKQYKDFPSSSNTTNLEELIHFIGNSENIITDSYHTMYWAMLLNKKVIAIPNSSKFFSFKHQPIIADFKTALQHVNKAQVYTDLLEECREINLKFAEKAFDYLNI